MGIISKLIKDRAIIQVLEILEGGEISKDNKVAEILSKCVGDIKNPIVIDGSKVSIVGDWVLGLLPFCGNSSKLNFIKDKIYNVYSGDEYLCKMRYVVEDKDVVFELCEKGSMEFRKIHCKESNINDIRFAIDVFKLDKDKN